MSRAFLYAPIIILHNIAAPAFPFEFGLGTLLAYIDSTLRRKTRVSDWEQSMPAAFHFIGGIAIIARFSTSDIGKYLGVNA